MEFSFQEGARSCCSCTVLQKTAQKILTAKDCTENMNGSVSLVISVKKYFGDYIEAKLDENIFNSHE